MKHATKWIALFAVLALPACMGSVEDGQTFDDDESSTPDPDESDTTTPPPTAETRITDGLVALYDFSEGSGTAVIDQTGSGYDLEILDPENVTWIAGGIDIVANTALVNPNPATHITTACTASNELTVEVWARTNSVVQEGPARVVSLSLNQNSRNFTLGQDATLANHRLRTNGIENPENGTPATISDVDAWNGQISHIVYTRGPDPILGEGSVWLNGNIAGTQPVPGSFVGWDLEYPLTLANEPTLNRPWRGQLFLVAIYCRALNAIEINQNLSVGY